MKNKKYYLSKRRTGKKKESPADYNFDIKFMCGRCGFELFFWFDGMEDEISGIKCENCNVVYPLNDFFIEHEEEIKKELWKMYGNDPQYAPFDIQEEFNRRYYEAGFVRDKPVFEENMILRGEDNLIN